MATVNIVRAYRAQLDIGVIHSHPLSAETLTSSGASQVNANAIANQKELWVITPLGNIWVTFAGSAAFPGSPTAAPGTTYLCPAGIPSVFSGVVGDKVAIIDAT